MDSRIWDAAIHLFASKGFAGTGIREIAEEAGLSVSALYYYVDNKEDLLVQIMQDAQSRLIAAGHTVVATFDDPVAALAGLVELHVAIHATLPLEARVVDSEVRALSEQRVDEIVALRDEYEGLWHEVLVRGLGTGVFSFSNPRTARLALLDMCNGVSAWYSPGGPLTIDELTDEFADLALALVRATREGSPVTVKDLDLPETGWFSSLLSAREPGSVGEDDGG